MLNELRRNPMTRKWVIYLTDPDALPALQERLERWQSEQEPRRADQPCPYCPEGEVARRPPIRVVREGRILDPRQEPEADAPGWDLRVVPHPEPVLGIDEPFKRRVHRIYDLMSGYGAHELILEHPEHDRSIWEMEPERLSQLMLLVRERFRDLKRDETLGHAIFFRNSGMSTRIEQGHPHSEIVVAPYVPEKVQKELVGANLWYRHKERCLLCDILGEEIRSRDLGQENRIVLETEHFLLLVPYFTSYPFEMWLLPRFHQYDFRRIEPGLTPELGQVLRSALDRLNRVLGRIPLTIHLLNSPNRQWGRQRGYWESIREDWHWRFSIVPRLPAPVHGYREYFMGSGSRVNPVLPELAALHLRE